MPTPTLRPWMAICTALFVGLLGIIFVARVAVATSFSYEPPAMLVHLLPPLGTALIPALVNAALAFLGMRSSRTPQYAPWLACGGVGLSTGIGCFVVGMVTGALSQLPKC